MAAPHAAGKAALVASEFSRFLGSAFKKAIMGSGRPLSTTRGKTVTGKMVDAEAAVTEGGPKR